MFMATQRRRRGQAQAELVAFVIRYKQENNGNSPSYSEIAEALDYGSKSAAYNVVMSIVAKNRPGSVVPLVEPEYYDVDDR